MLMKNNIILLILALSIVSCAKPKARKPIVKKESTYIKESVDRNKKLNQIEEAFFKKYMAVDSTHTYHTSSDGFYYRYNKKVEKNIPTPKSGDKVIMNLQIANVQNQILYTKEELGSKDQALKEDRMYVVDREDFILGVQKGIKLMKEGEIVTFLFPSNKAFGVTGFQDRIAPNQPLIIEVYLKKIN